MSYQSKFNLFSKFKIINSYYNNYVVMIFEYDSNDTLTYTILYIVYIVYTIKHIIYTTVTYSIQ